VWDPTAFVCNGELSMISEEKGFNQIAVPYLYLCIYLLLHIDISAIVHVACTQSASFSSSVVDNCSRVDLLQVSAT
jgi:hypothetical protein